MDRIGNQSEPAIIMPNPQDKRVTERITGIDQTGGAVETTVPVERALTLYLNAQEIVTMMTINDYPEYLALGYLLNQNMLKPDDMVTEVEYDDDLQVAVVRTERNTNYEQKLKKRTLTSGCAQGTAFGDLMEALESIELPEAELRTSWLYQMTRTINTIPSLYLEAGAIHGCVLCRQGEPLCYMEDVGRHNAVDKLAGWMYRQAGRSRRQDPLHDRQAHLGNDHQDGANGHSYPGLAVGLHRLGGLASASGWVDTRRQGARQALYGSFRRESNRLRPGHRDGGGRAGAACAQGDR